jgi:hypothetical protein
VSLPSDPVARIEAVGHRLFGKSYKARLAGALKIGRTSLHAYLTGAAPVPSDIDRRLATAVQNELVKRERSHGALIMMISQLLTVVRA